MPADMTPFQVDIAQSELDDLSRRLDATRWPDEIDGSGWDLGIPLGYVREVVDYWRHSYDWRAQEARMNAFDHFRTEIDGQQVHFIHARSAEPSAIPIILSHGWPGSFVEFLGIIGPLTDPAAYGGDPADAFHVVVPSLPGYGFSGPTHERGWTIHRIANAFATLMADLGYTRYGAQGGDWGSFISRELGIIDPRVLGVHLNLISASAAPGSADWATLTDDERARIESRADIRATGMGYSAIQGTRPQTLAYGLTDSPAGQLAWILEKFYAWTDSENSPEDAIDRDTLLTNVMIYWLTATAGSSARLYAESLKGISRTLVSSDAPTGVAVFPKELTVPIRRIAERTNNITRWTEFEHGGHFAALEQPGPLVDDIRAFFRDLR
ncbi:epoxide hydrolase family protein [Jatrophihabitans sp. DSM 45814]